MGWPIMKRRWSMFSLAPPLGDSVQSTTVQQRLPGLSCRAFQDDGDGVTVWGVTRRDVVAWSQSSVDLVRLQERRLSSRCGSEDVAEVGRR